MSRQKSLLQWVSFAMVCLFLVGCSAPKAIPTPSPTPPTATPTPVPPTPIPTPLEFTGRTTFVGYFTESGFEFSPADYNFCDATATLRQTGQNTYDLELLECGYRESRWELTITADGEVEAVGWTRDVTPPFEGGSLLAEVELHTGCEINNGTFPVFHGTWDGHSLRADTYFSSPCDGGVYWGDPGFWDGWEDIPGVDDPEGYLDDGVTSDDGPAQVTFCLELSVTG